MLWGDEEEEDAEEDLITEEMLEQVEYLNREEFNVPEILNDTFGDLDQIVQFLDELRKFEPKHDDKLKALLKLLSTDRVLKKYKLLIFSEFADTARYLHCELVAAGITGRRADRQRQQEGSRRCHSAFRPLLQRGLQRRTCRQMARTEIRVLISTDVLSEGLNLQDATRMINYDLHWNPVRLMQRIGRVDRRLNPQVEERLVADHPDQRTLRGKVVYWNFLPPEELNELLSLYKRVTQKTLQISKTFGIEGRKLLRPDDDYEALREFNESYEGQTTVEEGMRLELQRLLDADSGACRADRGLARSGLQRQGTSRRPAPRPCSSATACRVPTTRAGDSRTATTALDRGGRGDPVVSVPPRKTGHPRRGCRHRGGDPLHARDPRRCVIEQATLSEIRGKIEKHIKNTFLKPMQAPVGVKPILKAWMELN